MSYLQHEGMSKNRMYALIAVAILHVLMGYMLISGLAVKAVKVITGPMQVQQIDEEIVDVEEPPPPPERLEEIPPYVPPPDVVIEAPPPAVETIQATTTPPPPPPVIAPPAPTVIAPPSPVEVKPVRPRGRTVTISQDDYPAASTRAQEEGRMTVKVTVGTNGRVQSCEVVRSTGYKRLDERACQVAERRWRFHPATEDGDAVASTYTQNITWELK